MRPHSLEQLLETAAEHARDALGAASVSISRLEEEADLIRTIVNVGDLGPDEVRWPTDEVYPIAGDTRLASTIQDQQTHVDAVDDPQSEPYERDLLRSLGKGSSLATAIMVDGQPWGEFYATRHLGDDRFGADAIAYSEVLVAIFASAVSRTLREQALEELAFHDPLTGLYNRRGLDAQAAEIFDVPEGATRTVVVVALDMNGLKQVNDTAGHAQGDRQIRILADAVSAAIKPLTTGTVARVGGDEFTVVVADHGVDEVEAVLNTVCSTMAKSHPPIGVSAGLASAEIGAGNDVRPTELFAAADRAQYEAKRSRATGVVRERPPVEAVPMPRRVPVEPTPAQGARQVVTERRTRTG